MSERLELHRRVWNEKRIIREAYVDWYKKVLKDRSAVGGATIEVGGGGGNLKHEMPDVVSTDIEFCPWLDVCCDAHALPFKGESVSNLVLVDVLHHLADPVGFLRDASSVLRRGGRILMVEPFPSPFSSVVYKLLHPEPFDMNADYFGKDPGSKKEPWDANQAIPYLLFFKHRKTLHAALDNDYRIIRRERISWALYPASGGFEHRALVPDFFIPLLRLFEYALSPLRMLIAFRCYIVLEKR